MAENNSNDSPNTTGAGPASVRIGLYRGMFVIFVLTVREIIWGFNVVHDTSKYRSIFDGIDVPFLGEASKASFRNSFGASDPSVADETHEDAWWILKPSKARNETISLKFHGPYESKAPPFKRYDGVVFVTKVLGRFQMDIERLKQWICTIQHAYNDQMKYDIVIFTTFPWHPDAVRDLEEVAYPAKLTVSFEAPPLEEQLAAMTEEERQFLYSPERCNVTAGDNITWFHYCRDPGGKWVVNLGYAWQAEFRSYHIWTHPALAKYRYMIWIDSDAWLSEEWKVDPVDVMVQQNLTIMYAGWPYGRVGDAEVRDKLIHSYGTSICGINSEERDGGGHQLVASTCNESALVQCIAGAHHITDLDVYRKPIHQSFLKNFTQDYRFNRKADDQASVTIVGLMEQYLLNKDRESSDPGYRFAVGHEKALGTSLNIIHHCNVDAVNSHGAPCMIHNHYKNVLKEKWTGLEKRCGTYMGKIPKSGVLATESF